MYNTGSRTDEEATNLLKHNSRTGHTSKHLVKDEPPPRHIQMQVPGSKDFIHHYRTDPFNRAMYRKALNDIRRESFFTCINVADECSSYLPLKVMTVSRVGLL